MLACLAFALFATADAIAKLLSNDYAVVQVLFVGSIFAWLPAFIFFRQSGNTRSVWPRQAKLCLLRGVLTALSVLLIVWSFTRLPLADGYVLAFTAPLLVAALSGKLLQEDVSKRQWSAIVIGFIGILIMLRPGFQAINIGHAAALSSALIFALALLLLRRLGPTETPDALLATYLTATALLYGPFAWYVWEPPEGWQQWSMLAVAGFASGSGQFALIEAFRAAPAAIVAPMQYTQLIWGIAFGMVLFGDFPDLAVALGASLVVGSGWFVLRDQST